MSQSRVKTKEIQNAKETIILQVRWIVNFSVNLIDRIRKAIKTMMTILTQFLEDLLPKITSITLITKIMK